MKQRILTLCFCGTVFLGGTGVLRAGNEPQPVPTLTEIHMPAEWYREQMQLWGDHVRANPADAPAWLNYFKATRYAGFCDTSLSPQEAYQRQQAVVDEMGRAIPNSFEYHYTRWWSGGNDAERFAHLEKAFALRPDYAELSDDFISYYELQGDEEQMKFFCRKWYDTRAMAPGLLHYHYNVLLSLERNAVLVTSGDNDTYPVWLLQYAQHIRPDVTVLNLGLIADEQYRGRFMAQHGITGDDSLLGKSRTSTTSWSDAMGAFLQSIAESTTGRPLYIALTVEPDYLLPIRDRLYTVGLVNRYSERRIDNIALLKKNWELFTLDYLKHDVYDEGYTFNQSLLPQINMNYITPALLLYEHSVLAGEQGEAARLREFVLARARAGGQEPEVLEYLAQLEPQPEQQQPELPASVNTSVRTDGEEVQLYPNPASGVLTVVRPTAERADIRIATLQGAVVRTTTASGLTTTIDISGLATGTYILRMTTGRSDFSTTFRIER